MQVIRVSKILVTLLFGAMFATSAQAHEGKTIKGLKMPESAIVAKDGRVFVSEIGEFGKDGDGQITVIEKNGDVHAFATGLDDPKGLAIVGKNLFVADNHRVLKINQEGEVQVFAAAEAFPASPMFLNDLESDSVGNIYVSDSGDLKGAGGAIYKITPQGKVSIVAVGTQEPLVQAPNGLLMGKTRNCIMEVDFNSGILYRIDMKKGTFTEIAQGFGGGDGLVKAAKDQYYVSDWKNGKVFSVKTVKGGAAKVELIKDGLQSAADMTLSQDGKFLLVPDMKAGELVYLPIH